MAGRSGAILRVLLILLATLAGGTVTVRAASFEDAVGWWLDDDDAKALAALSALARSGDERAMLLLALLERRPFDSPFVAGLDRPGRVALFRAPGGAFGRSWLDSVRERQPFVAAINAALEADPVPLFRLGQGHAGRTALAQRLNRAPWDLALVEGMDRAPAAVRAFRWIGAAWALDPATGAPPPGADMQARAMDVLREMQDPLSADGLQLLAFAGARPVPPAATEPALAGRLIWYGRFQGEQTKPVRDASPGMRAAAQSRARAALMAATEAAPMRAMCEATCPAGVDACLETVWALTGGYVGMAMMHSPMDEFVPQAAYLASDRYRRELRTAARAARVPDTAPGVDACGAAMLRQ